MTEWSGPGIRIRFFLSWILLKGWILIRIRSISNPKPWFLHRSVNIHENTDDLDDKDYATSAPEV